MSLRQLDIHKVEPRLCRSNHERRSSSLMPAQKMQTQVAEHSLAEPYAASDDYDLIEAAVMETARGRWFLAEHARRERADERGKLMFAVRRLERVAEDNLDSLRFHQVADDLARKLDEVLSYVRLPAAPHEVDDVGEQARIEQRLIEPRPFIRK